MASNQQYLSKGFYQYAQIGNPVSVKNYIFLRKNEKKCLLIRFCNDLEYTVDAMDFSVVQMDSSGKVIGNTEISYGQMHFEPGSHYVTPAGIVVDEFCTDFRVVFSTVRSGRYEYYSKGGHVAVRYLRKETALEVGKKAAKKAISRCSVEKRSFGKPRLAVLLGTLGLVIMLGLSAFDAFARDYRFKHPEPEEEQTMEEQTEQQTQQPDVNIMETGVLTPPDNPQE